MHIGIIFFGTLLQLSASNVCIRRRSSIIMKNNTGKEGGSMTNLVKRAQKGDTDAFTQLIQSQMQTMYKTARAILKNDEDIADAIADTTLMCWERLYQLRKAEYFRTWITKILINKCNDVLRKKKELHYNPEIQELPAETQDYNNVEWIEVMQSLDEKYRLVMILHYVNGLNSVQISEALHMPASTVRSRLARGRKQIASIYNPCGKEKENRKENRKEKFADFGKNGGLV